MDAGLAFRLSVQCTLSRKINRKPAIIFSFYHLGKSLFLAGYRIFLGKFNYDMLLQFHLQDRHTKMEIHFPAFGISAVP